VIAVIGLSLEDSPKLTPSNGRIRLRKKHSSATPTDPQTPCRLTQGLCFGLPLSAYPPRLHLPNRKCFKTDLGNSVFVLFRPASRFKAITSGLIYPGYPVCTNLEKAWRRVKRSFVTRMLLVGKKRLASLCVSDRIVGLGSPFRQRFHEMPSDDLITGRL
jgi:hypothetical protein